MKIREEQAADSSDIRKITELAFKGKPYAGGDEQDVIDRLRNRGALSLSLVAVEGDNVVGHVAFSPATLDNEQDHWFALGPVSVVPNYQDRGIGSQLINTGLEHLERQGAHGFILTGNPDYYQRFGFELSPSNCPEGEPTAYFMLKKLVQKTVLGKFTFHHAFYGDI